MWAARWTGAMARVPTKGERHLEKRDIAALVGVLGVIER